MTRNLRHLVSILAGLLLFTALAYFTVTRPPLTTDYLAWALFTSLLIFTMTFGIPLAGGSVNLMPMTVVGGLLVMGPLPAAWMAFLGSLANIVLRWALAERLGARRAPGGLVPLVSVGLANAVIITLSLAGAGLVYQSTGGRLPLITFTAGTLLPFILLVIVFSGLNYVLVGLYLALGGNPQAVRAYLKDLPQVVGYEVAPQVFTPLLPLIYHRLGAAPFFLYAEALVLASLAVRRLSLTSERLQQRLTDLSTLSATGQALAASLEVDTVLALLREQLPRVMPADSLYVALYDPGHDEISFPLVVEDGQIVERLGRRAGQGLTEHILRTRQPLLIPRDVAARIRSLGITQMGRASLSWVGVPLLAGNAVLGVLALQTFNPEAKPYTDEHRDLLVIIASQLAVALNNARLYKLSDATLAQRVQEMSSILDTMAEGVLLLDTETRVLTTNRALGHFLNLAVSDLAGRRLAAAPERMARLGFKLHELEQDLAGLRTSREQASRTITALGAPPRTVERTLTAVRATSGAISGWLLILRDVTEEQALTQLRDDLTHMLIHDLRSPLGSILTSVALIQQVAKPGQPLEQDIFDLLGLAQSSGQQLLRLINQLLEIARLESGAVPLNRQPALPAGLVEAAVERLRTAAEAEAVNLTCEVGPGLSSTVPVDPELIGRVLDNLLDNAIKYSPDGGTVRLWVRPSTIRGLVVFGVRDEGPGIAQEEQDHLFQKFQRIRGQRARRGGTGLGLAFCKLVVEAHQGKIWLDSAPGAGSTFAFSLPIEAPSLDAD